MPWRPGGMGADQPAPEAAPGRVGGRLSGDLLLRSSSLRSDTVDDKVRGVGEVSVDHVGGVAGHSQRWRADGLLMAQVVPGGGGEGRGGAVADGVVMMAVVAVVAVVAAVA